MSASPGPAVSVAIPVRNRPDVVHRAIESAFAQTYPICEVVVVDDGSTDGTPEAIHARWANEARLRLIVLPERGGAPRARNRAAANTAGELLAFLDSDDSWHPEKLARQVALLARHPESPACFTDILYRYANRRSRRSHTPAVVRKRDLYLRNVLGSASAALVRKDAFLKVGGFQPELPSCQDWEMWLRLAHLGDLVVVGEPLLNYHLDGGSRISKNLANVLAGHRFVFETVMNEVSDPVERQRIRAEHLSRMAEIYSMQTFAPLAAGKAAFAAAFTEFSPARVQQIFRIFARLALYPFN